MNDSANALGVYVPAGAQITGIPDAMYPAPESLVKRILQFDPYFRPLWVNQWWKSPNGGIVKTGHHMLARHVRHPRSPHRVIKGLMLPAYKEYGIRYEAPILEALLLDGLSEEERNRGVLPKYVPFTGILVENMREMMWRRNNLDPVKRAIAAEQRREAAEEKAKKTVDDNVSYARKHDAYRFPKNGFINPRVFVSDTLVKVREEGAA